ncbi:MAG: SusC/RagA family TonB-linked outer membrane protein, partial [Muribaculaceae bacterium]
MNSMKHYLLSALILLMAAITAQAQNITVNGTVLSATDDEPLIGASVVPASSNQGVTTDYDGNFTISIASGEKLTISYIGFQTITVQATDGMTVRLKEDALLLNEVVAVGYSTQRKVDVTGAITAVDVNEISKQNENNPIKALQGRVPGMNISAEGSPSGAATVRIRGIGTLNNNDPLYIIDGVPTKSGMHELNPNDIESIQILKDAASASIYGSRAANGVIIITTKKGKDLRVTLDASVAAQFYTNQLKVLNAEGYGQAMWQAYVNDGQDPNTNGLGYNYNWGYDANGYPVLHSITMDRYLDAAGTTPSADTDWLDETTRTGVTQNYNLSVSGSTDQMSAFFSLGYYKNMGIIKYSDFERISARMNTEFNLLNKMVTFGEHFTINRNSEVQAP